MTKPVTDPSQLHDCLWAYLDQLRPPGTNRARLANAAFRFIIDCHQALPLLTRKGLHGPTFVLVRSMLEGLQRGYWLYYCAPDDTINNLNNTINELNQGDSSRIIQKIDNRLFSINVIEDIKSCQHFKQGRFLFFKNFLLGEKSQKNRDAMNSYTHVGYLMLRNYVSEDAIGPNFDREAIHEVLRLANCCACFAVMGAAEAAENGNVSEKVFSIYRSLS